MDCTPEEVDQLIAKFEKAAEKQISKAPEDVTTAEEETLKPMFKVAEKELLPWAEEIRDMLNHALVGTKEADREKLDEIYGKGCNCVRFTRIHDVLGKVTFSKMSANDPRWQQVKEKMLAIEEILRQRGSFIPPVRGMDEQVAPPSDYPCILGKSIRVPYKSLVHQTVNSTSKSMHQRGIERVSRSLSPKKRVSFSERLVSKRVFEPGSSIDVDTMHSEANMSSLPSTDDVVDFVDRLVSWLERSDAHQLYFSWREKLIHTSMTQT